MDSFDTTLLVTFLFAYLLYRQSVRRPVTRRDFILPALGASYLTLRYLNVPGSPAGIFVQVSAAVGMFTGLVAGGLVRVWREPRTNLVYQYGGWRYAAVLIALLLVRVVVHLFTDATGISASVGILNDGLIAVALGNYLGRNVHVGVRALHLHGWNPRAIPRHREARKLKS